MLRAQQRSNDRIFVKCCPKLIEINLNKIKSKITFL